MSISELSLIFYCISANKKLICIQNVRKQYNDVIDRHLFWSRAAKFGVKYGENKSKTLRETYIKNS